MHVEITNGGTVDHGVQLIQTPIPLEKGAKYRASFSAKAENERDIKVKIGGDGDREWMDYADEAPITLSTEWEDYEFEFTMPEDTDLKARYEFNMGLNDADVWLGDVRLDMIEEAPVTDPSDDARPTLPTGNHIYNGTFDQGTDRFGFWEFRTDESADAVEYIGDAVDERKFEAHITSGGDHAESIQLVQPDVNLEDGKSYQLNFEANADAPRSLQISVVSTNGNVVSDQTVDLDTEMKEYLIDFDVDVVTDNDVELRFNMGGSKENVYIDNVILERVLQSDGIEDNLIQNGIFDSLKHWTTELNHAQAKFKIDEDGHFNVNITDVGDDTWTIQLYQEGVNIEKDATYELSFKAKSTIDRPILLQLEHNNDYTTYFAEDVLITDSWETYNYTFTMDYDSDPDTKFGFSFGGDSSGDIPSDKHDVYIDDVVLKKLEDQETEDPDKDNGDDEGTETGDQDEDNDDDEGTETGDQDEDNDDDEGTETGDQDEDKSDGEGTETGDQDEDKGDGEGTETEDQDEGNSDNEGTETEDQASPVIGDKDSDEDNKEGEKLPKTASSMFNWLVMGVILLVIGIGLTLYKRRNSLT